MACIDPERRLHAWGTSDGARLRSDHPLPAADPPTALALSPDGRRAVVGFASGTVRLIFLDEPPEATPGTRTHVAGSVQMLAFSADGASCAAVVAGQGVVLLDGRELSPTGVALPSVAPIGSILFSPDGTRVITAGADGFARIWHAASGRELLALRADGAPPVCMILTADQERLVVGDEEGGLSIWDAVRWERRAAELRAQPPVP